MSKELNHSPEHYRQRLSVYAAYTIDYETPVGVLRQKINQHDGFTITDNGNGSFSIHIAYQRVARLAFTHPINRGFKKDFSAIVTIGEHVVIEAQRNESINYLSAAWFIFLAAVALINFLDARPFFFLLLLPLIPLPFLIQRENNKRLHTLLIDFLNSI